MNPDSPGPAAAVTKGVGCLHLVLISSGELLDECIAFMGVNDSIVLLDTAVNLLARPDIATWLPADVPVYCHEVDLLAQGLGKVVNFPGIAPVDDLGLIKLVCQHGHCLSWK
jgi:sulfur transfer complex TusBCD TusB component (DsrH family)